MQNLEAPREQSWLTWFFRGLLVLGVFILMGRLLELQVIKGAYYRNLAEGNRIRRVAILAPRGEILDKNGDVIVGNKAVEKTVVFDPMEGYAKVAANEDTPRDEIITEYEREYVFGADFGHITGYLGEVNASEVNKIEVSCAERGPRMMGSFLGRGGLEQFYDCTLRGVAGEEMVEVDTRGNRVRTLGRKMPLSGDDITTNIDARLQKKVAEAMKGKTGSVIVSTQKGRVEALYSSPSFDPNVFVQRDEQAPKKIEALFSDTTLPLFNRAILGTYPPGSIYKVVTSVAALEEGKVDEGYTYEDTGVVTAGDSEYRNWFFTQYGGVEGAVNITRALARSTNTFFYEVGAMLGAEALADWSNKFGLDTQTGIDLPGEAAGLVPSPAWKKATKGERWFLGNTYHMSIGQGDLATSVAATHRILMTIANKGVLCNLRLVGAPECHSIGISDETLSTVNKGLLAACAPGGTGAPFFDFSAVDSEGEKISVACKTGTAQPMGSGDTHAWFSAYIPAENPERVITVFVEHGGEGSQAAAPVAREIADFIYNP